jgi:hypothetical protein
MDENQQELFNFISRNFRVFQRCKQGDFLELLANKPIIICPTVFMSEIPANWITWAT